MSLAGSGPYVTMEESFGEKRGVRLSGNRGGDVVDYLIAGMLTVAAATLSSCTA
jgi:hypothetical protein